MPLRQPSRALASRKSPPPKIFSRSRQRIPERRIGRCRDYDSAMSNSAPTASPTTSQDVQARARKIKLFLMDVDGTITDGGVCLISSTSADGNATVSEMKVFNAQDGQGLSLAHTMGIQTGFITGRRSPAVAKRAEELKVTFVNLGQAQEDAGLSRSAWPGPASPKTRSPTSATICLTFLSPSARGLAVCVADGAPEPPTVCHYTTQRPGGRGTAREVVELILKAQGRWEEAVHTRPRALEVNFPAPLKYQEKPDVHSPTCSWAPSPAGPTFPIEALNPYIGHGNSSSAPQEPYWPASCCARARTCRYTATSTSRSAISLRARSSSLSTTSSMPKQARSHPAKSLSAPAGSALHPAQRASRSLRPGRHRQPRHLHAAPPGLDRRHRRLPRNPSGK